MELTDAEKRVRLAALMGHVHADRRPSIGCGTSSSYYIGDTEVTREVLRLRNLHRVLYQHPNDRFTADAEPAVSFDWGACWPQWAGD